MKRSFEDHEDYHVNSSRYYQSSSNDNYKKNNNDTRSPRDKRASSSCSSSNHNNTSKQTSRKHKEKQKKKSSSKKNKQKSKHLSSNSPSSPSSSPIIIKNHIISSSSALKPTSSSSIPLSRSASASSLSSSTMEYQNNNINDDNNSEINDSIREKVFITWSYHESKWKRYFSTNNQSNTASFSAFNNNSSPSSNNTVIEKDKREDTSPNNREEKNSGKIKEFLYAFTEQHTISDDKDLKDKLAKMVNLCQMVPDVYWNLENCSSSMTATMSTATDAHLSFKNLSKEMNFSLILLNLMKLIWDNFHLNSVCLFIEILEHPEMSESFRENIIKKLLSVDYPRLTFCLQTYHFVKWTESVTNLRKTNHHNEVISHDNNQKSNEEEAHLISKSVQTNVPDWLYSILFSQTANKKHIKSSLRQLILLYTDDEQNMQLSVATSDIIDRKLILAYLLYCCKIFRIYVYCCIDILREEYKQVCPAIEKDFNSGFSLNIKRHTMLPIDKPDMLVSLLFNDISNLSSSKEDNMNETISILNQRLFLIESLLITHRLCSEQSRLVYNCIELTLKWILAFTEKDIVLLLAKQVREPESTFEQPAKQTQPHSLILSSFITMNPNIYPNILNVLKKENGSQELQELLERLLLVLCQFMDEDGKGTVFLMLLVNTKFSEKHIQVFLHFLQTINFNFISRSLELVPKQLDIYQKLNIYSNTLFIVKNIPSITITISPLVNYTMLTILEDKSESKTGLATLTELMNRTDLFKMFSHSNLVMFIERIMEKMFFHKHTRLAMLPIFRKFCSGSPDQVQSILFKVYLTHAARPDFAYLFVGNDGDLIGSKLFENLISIQKDSSRYLHAINDFLAEKTASCFSPPIAYIKERIPHSFNHVGMKALSNAFASSPVLWYALTALTKDETLFTHHKDMFLSLLAESVFFWHSYQNKPKSHLIYQLFVLERVIDIMIKVNLLNDEKYKKLMPLVRHTIEPKDLLRLTLNLWSYCIEKYQPHGMLRPPSPVVSTSASNDNNHIEGSGFESHDCDVRPQKSEMNDPKLSNHDENKVENVEPNQLNSSLDRIIDSILIKYL